VIVGSGGTLALAVVPLTLVCYMNRLRNEYEYNKEVKRRIESIDDYFKEEARMVTICVEAIATATARREEFLSVIQGLSDNATCQHVLGALHLSCPLLRTIIKDAPTALGHASMYYVCENHETSLNIATAVLPTVFDTLSFLGVQNIPDVVSMGFHALPFVGAALGLALNTKLFLEAIHDEENGADEIIAPLRAILEKRVEVIETLRRLLQGQS
jgi:hypothetical protein